MEKDVRFVVPNLFLRLHISIGAISAHHHPSNNLPERHYCQVLYDYCDDF
jgi:hypothetical protein